MIDDALLQTILDASETGVVLLDAEQRVVLWNDWMARASDIRRDRAVGAALVDLFPEVASSRLARAVGEAATSGMSSLLSSSLNKHLLPLFKPGGGDAQLEPLKQVIVIKALPRADGTRWVMMQVTDITNAVARESILRQQARTMQALAENYRLSELHIRAIVESTADAIFTFDQSGVIGTYNPAAEVIFGYAAEEIVGRNVGVLVPELGPPPGQSSGSAAGGFTGRRREVAGRRKDASALPIELGVSEMELGGQRLFIGIAHDITERKQAEEDLRTQKEWLTTLINAMPDIVCFKDGQGRWLVANHFYLNLFGLADADYLGKTAKELTGLAARGNAVRIDSALTDQQAWREGRPIAFEHTVTLEDGQVKVFDMLKIPLFNPDASRKGLVVVGRDITDRKMAAARIQHLAHYDSLTDLPNRVLFQDRLRTAIPQARRGNTIIGLMFLDMDKFKDINDTLGHHVGDLLLQAAARRLQRCVRETDTVARLGGDEFAVLLTNLQDADGASRVADSIVRSMAEPFRLDDNEVLTSASIGITLFPSDSTEPEQLLKNADLALYRSKAEGRNNYHFYVAQMDAEVQARKAMERDLRQALGSTQLVLFYQPLIDMTTGHISGAEALIRWFHPTRGFISPAEFIPVAERSDLIMPIGRWVLHRACSQVTRWQEGGMGHLRVAINLSAAQFKHQDLVAMIREMIEDTGVDPEMLQLEITESIAMHNVEATIETLNQIRDMGIQISIDDFGTGYSSLNYLKRFPVDKLKIDRSFVTDVGLHPDNAAIVRAIINLGHSIGTKVNVEGIETHDQLDFLRVHKVDEAQGFLFSKPVPAEEFARLVNISRPWHFYDPRYV